MRRLYYIVKAILIGSMVKRSRHRPFTAVTRVRFPVESPKKGTSKKVPFFVTSPVISPVFEILFATLQSFTRCTRLSALRIPYRPLHAIVRFADSLSAIAVKRFPVVRLAKISANSRRETDAHALQFSICNKLRATRSCS